MAWNLHWQCCFQSYLSRQFAINIYEQNYQGSVVRLTGASNPFVTQENSDDDIFTAIRCQTGYIRLIDTDGTLLETLIPSNNTQKLVRLYNGTYANDTFTPSNLMWAGFLCAQTYTQEWDNQVKVLEFPIKSLLGCLEDVYIEDSVVGTDCNIAKLVVNAFQSIGKNPNGCYIISNLEDVETEMLKKVIDPQIFFSTKMVNNDNSAYEEWIGESYFDVLSKVASLFGITFRENKGALYIVMYDNGEGKIGLLEMPQWSQIELVANGGTYGGSMTGVQEFELMDYAEFAGTDNNAGFVQGGKNASVTLEISDNKFSVDIPQADETDDAPVELAMHEGKLYVQPHAPRTRREETFFYEYLRHNLQGSSDYATMLNATVIKGYTYDPYYSDSIPLYTGAFPCRWFRQKDVEPVVLQNGIYLNTQYRYGTTPISYNNCYKVRSLTSFKAKTGWLNIKFNWNDLIHYDGAGGNPWIFDDARSVIGDDITTEIHMCLQVGNKFWNGTAWVTGSAPSTEFWFRLTNGNVPDNKTSDMNTDEDKGYFIPINEQLSGFVTFHILNAVIVSFGSEAVRRFCYTHILYDLNITHILPLSITASERSTNAYRKLITSGGFPEDKEISLSVGTINNNYPSPCFLMDANEKYVESLNYYYQGGAVKGMRPEMNLLSRMVKHYNQMRRTYKAVLQVNMGSGLGLDYFTYRYTYLGRKFFGVLCQQDWRDDTQEVKFIEVT